MSETAGPPAPMTPREVLAEIITDCARDVAALQGQGAAMTLTDRIAVVLQEHMLTRYDRRAWWCACGADCLNTEDSHARHVAERIEAELAVRITAVLRRHVSAQTENWETKLRCECGRGDFTSKLEYAAHVAEQITTALGLTVQEQP